MPAPLALIQVLTGSPATSAASASAAALTLLGAAAQVALVAPRLVPRAADALALGEAIVLLAASWSLLALAGLWWPVWPAVIALLSGQLAMAGARRAGRAAAMAPAQPATVQAPKPSAL